MPDHRCRAGRRDRDRPPRSPSRPRAAGWPLRVAAAAAVLSVGGCGGDPAGPAGPAAGPGADPSASQGEQVITGNATFDEQLRLPADSVLVVQLLELADASAPAGGDPAPESSVRLVNVQGPSIPFALPYDPAEVEQDGLYGLRARLSDPGARVLFATRAPVPVRPGRTEPIVFDMAYVGVQTAYWQCGSLRLAAGVDPLARMVRLHLPGQVLELAARALVPAAGPAAGTAGGSAPPDEAMPRVDRGREYTDGAGNSFRIQGARATLTLDDREQPECVRSAQAPPWYAAAERGVAFRAAGNEPGWWVEVDRGAAPALRAALDYGEREIELARARTTATGFAGETADGTPVRLDISREPCRDGMSGERFGASARLAVGGDVYAGCGAFL